MKNSQKNKFVQKKRREQSKGREKEKKTINKEGGGKGGGVEARSPFPCEGNKRDR